MNRCFLGLFVLLFSSSILVLAQTAGTLTGEVLDPSKASIGGAKVTATNLATGQKREATSDASGRYTIPDVRIGTYTVTAEQTGFQKRVASDIAVGVAQQVTVNFDLETGTLTQVVEVAGQATPIEETTGTTFNNRAIVDLPINGRDYARFSLLTPGAAASSNFIAMLTVNGR